MSRVQKMTGIVGFVVVLGTGIENALAACPTFPTGFTCECNAADTEWVCAKWGQGGTPTHLLDFTVVYVSGVPDVTLSTADLGWELYSEVISTGAAADIGTLDLDNSGALDFEVKISKAKNVTTINLDDTGFTGYSSLEGFSIILGNLGGLTLVQDGENPPNGGELAELATLLVLGDLTGPLTIPKILGTLNCTGKLIGAADITIGEIGDEDNSAVVTVGGLECAGACPNITVTVRIYDSILTVAGDVPNGSTVKIEELEEPDPQAGPVTAVNLSDGYVFAGTLDLPNGLANANTLINLAGNLSGVIDLHGGAVAEFAEIAVYGGTSTAEIKNGGAVSGDVYLGQNVSGQELQYDGTARFASVTSTGEIATQVLSGGPTVRCHFGGILNVTGGMAGLIEIVGSHLLGAQINIGASASGDIVIEDDCVGSLSISGSIGSFKGDIHIEGDVTSDGSVEIAGTLGGVGRILVDGLTDGAIRIGKKTTSLTLIHLPGGLGECGTVEINTTRGNFNAHGDIHIGGPIVTPLPPVTFDGCIRIYDNGIGGGGALKGDIDIVGCHDPVGEELMICIDGPIIALDSVTLHQTGCGGVPATWGCLSPGCP